MLIFYYNLIVLSKSMEIKVDNLIFYITINCNHYKLYLFKNICEGGNVMDIKDLVLNILKESDEPLRPGEIAEKANLDRKEVDKAIKALKKEELIESPKRCYYAAK